MGRVSNFQDDIVKLLEGYDSQRELAQALDVPENLVSKWRTRGKIHKLPGVDYLVAVRKIRKFRSVDDYLAYLDGHEIEMVEGEWTATLPGAGVASSESARVAAINHHIQGLEDASKLMEVQRQVTQQMDALLQKRRS